VSPQRFFSKYRFEVCFVLVGALFGFHVWLKTTKIFAHPTWDATDDTGQFWSEFAVHYRFARFFAEHPIADWGQLAGDRKIQHPDEINSWSEFTIAMEVPVGVLYRWIAPRMPFHRWVVWYSCIVSSLILFGVFFLAGALWRSDWSGLFAAFLYATIYPSYGRTVKNLFLKEDFALPLIMFALFFTVRAMQRRYERTRLASGGNPNALIPTTRSRSWLAEFLAAFFWLAALASWHLTQFLLAVFVGAMAIYFLGRNETLRLPWLVACLAVGGMLIPVLADKQFYVSPMMCALYALACVEWAGESRASRLFVFVSTCAAFLLLGHLAQKSVGEYSHVYQLFFAKLKWFGVKPENPAALPFHARSLWEGAFNTARLSEFWQSLQWCLPCAALSSVAAFHDRRDESRKNDPRAAMQIFICFTLLLFPLSWMVIRFFTFLGFAAAVAAAGIWRLGWNLLQTKSSKIAVVMLGIIACAWQLLTLDLKPLDRGLQPTPAEVRPVVEWLQRNTAPEAVILATIADSPVYLVHTGRSTVMHSKFENERIRLRWQEMLEAIYGTEEMFHAFSSKYNADIFIFDLGFAAEGVNADDAKQTRLYKAGLRALPQDCAARTMREHPESLRRFKMELRTERFTVFRVLP
jgi:hypothetical protein